MRRLARIMIYTLLISLVIVGCKREVKKESPQQLLSLIEQINSQPDRELANGLVLTECQLDRSQSMLVYYITVKDSRFDKLSEDSIKSIVENDLIVTGKKNIVSALKKYSLGVKYVCTLPDGSEKVIAFTPAEIKRN